MITNKNIIRDYFIFSKRERRGIIALSSIIILSWIFFQSIIYLIPEAQWDFKQVKNELILLQKMQLSEKIKTKEQKKYYKKSLGIFQKNKNEIVFHPQDPNEISFKDWMKLGLSFEETKTLMNQKKKMKGIKSQEDFISISGISTQKTKSIIPYLNFKKNPDAIGTEINANGTKKEMQIHIEEKTLENLSKQKIKNKETFEINSCNSRAFRQFDCIDSLTAQKIIQRRKYLGGFVSVSQLLEIDSLSELCISELQKFALTDTSMLNKIDINNISIKSLGRHPYIGYNIATALVNYRDKHGRFSGPEDLKKCMVMTTEKIEKLKPYLLFR